MIRKELAKRIATYLHENNFRKPVSSKKQVFHISDDNGNSKDFVVKQSEKTVMYTIKDIEIFIDAYMSVIEDALKRGESVTIRNFGTFGLKYRKPRTARHPDTGELVEIDARYVPKFTFANGLRMAAKNYELLLAENNYTEPLPLFDEDSEEEED